jgi:hypothetical protein
MLNFCVISGFRREIDEICPLLGYNVAYGVIPYTTFRDDLSGPIFNGQQVPKRRLGIITIHCVKSQKRADFTLDVCPSVIIKDQTVFIDTKVRNYRENVNRCI